MKIGVAFVVIQPQHPSRTFVPVATVKGRASWKWLLLGKRPYGLWEALQDPGLVWGSVSHNWRVGPVSWSSIEEVQKSAQAWSSREGLFFVCALQPGLMQKAKGS